MKRRRTVTLLAVLMFQLLVCSQLGWAEFLSEQKDTLKGKKKIAVSVSVVGKGLINAGLKQEYVRTDVESKLRMAGIEVVEPEKSDGYLDITVGGSITTGGNKVYFSITVEFFQKVFLYSNPGLSCAAATWRKGGVGTESLNRVSYIREFLKKNVDAFLNDYLAVNPKK